MSTGDALPGSGGAESGTLYKRNLVSVVTKGHFGEGKHRSKFGHGQHRKSALHAIEKIMHVDIEADAVVRAEQVQMRLQRKSRRKGAIDQALAMATVNDTKQAVLSKNLELAKEKRRAAMVEKIARKRRMVETLTARFNHLDADKDGVIEWSDMRQVLSMENKSIAPVEQEAVLKQLVRTFDTSGTGKLEIGAGLKMLHALEKASMLRECVAHVHDVVTRFDAQADTDAAIDAASPFSRDEIAVLLDCAHSSDARALLDGTSSEDGELSVEHMHAVVHALHAERAAILSLASGSDAAAQIGSAFHQSAELSNNDRRTHHLAVVVRLAQRIDSSRPAPGATGSVSLDELKLALASEIPDVLLEGLTPELRDLLVHEIVAEHDVSDDGTLYIDELEAKLAHAREAARHGSVNASVAQLAAAAAQRGEDGGDATLSVVEMRAMLEADPRGLDRPAIDALLASVVANGAEGATLAELESALRRSARGCAAAIAAADAYTNVSALRAATERRDAAETAARLRARLERRQRRQAAKDSGADVERDTAESEEPDRADNDDVWDAASRAAASAGPYTGAHSRSALQAQAAYAQERMNLAQAAQASAAAGRSAAEAVAAAALESMRTELRAVRAAAQRESESHAEELTTLASERTARDAAFDVERAAAEEKRAAAAKEHAAERDEHAARVLKLETELSAARAPAAEAAKGTEPNAGGRGRKSARAGRAAKTAAKVAARGAAAATSAAADLKRARAATKKYKASAAELAKKLSDAEAARDESNRLRRTAERAQASALERARVASAKAQRAGAALKELSATSAAAKAEALHASVAAAEAAREEGVAHEDAHVRALARAHHAAIDARVEEARALTAQRDAALASESRLQAALDLLTAAHAALEARCAAMHDSAIVEARTGALAESELAAVLTRKHAAAAAEAARALRVLQERVASLEAALALGAANRRQLEVEADARERASNALAERAAAAAAAGGLRHEAEHVRALAQAHAAEIASLEERLADANSRALGRLSAEASDAHIRREAARRNFDDQMARVEERLQRVSESIGDYVERCDAAKE
jgi:Ca2+-binding EF-hand superfamily protein